MIIHVFRDESKYQDIKFAKYMNCHTSSKYYTIFCLHENIIKIKSVD